MWIYDGRRYLHERRNRTTTLRFMTEESRQLQGNDDAANTTHEAGDDGVRHKSDVLAKAQ